VFLLALLLQLGFGLSAFHAGLVTLASAAGSVAMRFTFRPVLHLFGFRWLLICNGLLTGVYLILCGRFDITTPFWFILLVLVIGGYSRSVQFTAAQALQYADMPTGLMSRATSFAAMAQQLAQSIGVGLTALAVHLSLTLHGHTTISSEDVALGFFTIGLAAILSTIFFLRLPPDAGAELTERRG
jgi:hypothetical protein